MPFQRQGHRCEQRSCTSGVIYSATAAAWQAEGPSCSTTEPSHLAKSGRRRGSRACEAPDGSWSAGHLAEHQAAPRVPQDMTSTGHDGAPSIPGTIQGPRSGGGDAVHAERPTAELARTPLSRTRTHPPHGQSADLRALAVTMHRRQRPRFPGGSSTCGVHPRPGAGPQARPHAARG